MSFLAEFAAQIGDEPVQGAIQLGCIVEPRLRGFVVVPVRSLMRQIDQMPLLIFKKAREGTGAGSEDAAGFTAGTGEDVATAAEGRVDVAGMDGATGAAAAGCVAEGVAAGVGSDESALDPTSGFVAAARIFL